MTLEKVKAVFVRDNDSELKYFIEKAKKEDKKEIDAYVSPAKIYLGGHSRNGYVSLFKQTMTYSPV